MFSLVFIRVWTGWSWGFARSLCGSADETAGRGSVEVHCSVASDILRCLPHPLAPAESLATAPVFTAV